MSFENENSCDPRARLAREKYFSIRPRPLERWLWAQGIPSSAERVFWLHWQEGMQRGDWCSEVPLRRVARECSLDVSTVTRAYQLLTRLGCIRRTDPGRDPANPFQQATAVTEVRVPRELLAELDRHPNRRRIASAALKSDDQPSPGSSVPAPSPPDCGSPPSDPFAGLRGKDRVRALSEITQQLSNTERRNYQDAMRLHRASMVFDSDSRLSEQARQSILAMLALLAAEATRAGKSAVEPSEPGKRAPPRTLSVFDLARLKREIQAATSTTAAPELLRQVVWSVQSGALRRFDALHAVHIALKKIRQGAWSRPNRMPPNWSHPYGTAEALEACRRA